MTGETKLRHVSADLCVEVRLDAADRGLAEAIAAALGAYRRANKPDCNINAAETLASVLHLALRDGLCRMAEVWDVQQKGVASV